MFIDARKRLVSWENKVRDRDLIEVWPVIRVSIERLILNEMLGSTEGGKGSTYFNAFTKDKMYRLLSIDAIPTKANGGREILFALPERLANRGINNRNPYFGWIKDCLEDESFVEYKIGNLRSWRRLLELLIGDIRPAFQALLLVISFFKVVFEALQAATGNPLSWNIKGTIKVLLRLCCFKIYVSRFDRSSLFDVGQLVITTASKDVAMMAFVSSANKAGANVAEVQHGLFYEGDFGYTPWQQFSHSSCLPTIYFAWNRADADLVKRAFNIAEERIIVTGLLTADPSLVESLSDTSSGFERDCVTCLLVLQPSQYICPEEMAKIVSVVMTERDRLDIRIHPDGRDSRYLQDFKRHLPKSVLDKVRVVESTQIAAHEHILQASCVLGETSSMVLEAAHLGVPAALVGTAVEKLATYAAIPECLTVSSDAESINQFLNDTRVSFSSRNLPNVEELERSINVFKQEL